MSKSISAGHIANLAKPVKFLAWALTITRTDAVGSPVVASFRYTSGMLDATIGGYLYEAAPGFTVSSITATLGVQSVDTLELTVLTNDDMVAADFLSGRWDRALCEFNQYNWAVPTDGFIPWPKYRIANIKPISGGFVIEMRDLRQLLRQDYTLSLSKTCQNRFGDAKCTKPLGPLTFAFTVTSVTSRSVFTCSALAQATDYFANGIATFATGLHAGLPLLVTGFTTGGIITLGVPLIADIAVAQTGTIIAGCLKRFDEDCKTKHANVLNFRGHKDIPQVADLVQ